MAAMNAPTLFLGNIIVLLTMAMAFHAAWTRQREVRYWRTWVWANLLLVGGLTGFLLSSRLSLPWGTSAANLLLVTGYGMRWRAARQLAERSDGWLWPILIPAAIVVASHVVSSPGTNQLVSAIGYGCMTAQTFASAWEFWRDRADRLPSRYGLVLSYAAAGVVFAVRFATTTANACGLESWLPKEVAIASQTLLFLHTVGSGTFALSIAFERKAEALHRLALTDTLTELPNRRAFEERLRRFVSERRPDASLAILDIDHFKRINDTFGHEWGDIVLCNCARTLAAVLPNDAVLARTGGEEFQLLFDGRSQLEAEIVLERMRREVERSRVLIDGQRVQVTISGGLAHESGGFHDTLAPIRQADKCLYAAKLAGRNKIARVA